MSDFPFEGLLELIGIHPATGEQNAVVLDDQSSSGSGNLKPICTRFIGYCRDIGSDVAVRVLHEGKDIVLDFNGSMLAVIDGGLHT